MKISKSYLKKLIREQQQEIDFTPKFNGRHVYINPYNMRWIEITIVPTLKNNAEFKKLDKEIKKISPRAKYEYNGYTTPYKDLKPLVDLFKKMGFGVEVFKEQFI